MTDNAGRMWLDSDARYRLLFESMGDGFIVAEMIFDPQGQPVDYIIRDINPAYEKMTGLRREQVLGKRVTEVLPVVEPVWFERYAEVVRTGQPQRFEEYNVSLDRWFEVYAYPIPPGNKFAIIFTDISCCKKAEEDILSLNQDMSRRIDVLKTLINVLPISVSMTEDLDCKHMVANPFMEKLLGIEPGTNMSMSASPGEKANFKAYRDGRELSSDELPIQRAIATGKPVYGAEYDIHRKDGVVINYYGHAVPLLDEEGRVRGAIGAFDDVTQRNLAERKICRQNAVLAGINRIFQETLSSDSEQELCRICLAVAKELTGSSFGFIGELTSEGKVVNIAISDPGWEACHLDEQTGLLKLKMEFNIRGIFREMLRGGKAFLTHNPSYHHRSIGLPEGHPPVTAFLGAPLSLEGKVIGMIGLGNPEKCYSPEDLEIVENLTSAIVQALKRKRAERALNESEERLRQALDGAGAGLWVLGSDGGWQITPRINELFGLSVDDPSIQIHEFSALIHPDDLPLVRKKWVASVELGEIYDQEYRVLARDGNWRWMASKGRSVRTQDGQRRFVGITYDISEQKQADKALRESEERYRSITEELREADRQKNEFMAVLSHELRNPLAAINNSIYILDRAAPGGNQAQQAKDVIGRQVGQLVRLVDDLLDATRISRNKIQLKRERLELNQLVQRTIEDFRPLYEKNGVQLEEGFNLSSVFVQADPARIAQVVGNLLHNAVKFTDRDGSVCVRIEVDSQQGQAVIRVTDTGVGMSPETVAGLFKPFMQADTSLDRSRGGLGLGLTIAKGLVELHGGNLSALSMGLGEGSEFVVHLPLDTAGDMVSFVSERGAVHRGRRVLIIEDRPDVAESLRDVVEIFGHHVQMALSGPEGIRIAREFRPEVVLCDIGLPDMDGYEVARAFRADVSLTKTYLVALSGYTQPEDMRRSAEAGFDRHLAKPPVLDELDFILTQMPTGS